MPFFAYLKNLIFQNMYVLNQRQRDGKTEQMFNPLLLLSRISIGTELSMSETRRQASLPDLLRGVGAQAFVPPSAASPYALSVSWVRSRTARIPSGIMGVRLYSLHFNIR